METKTALAQRQQTPSERFAASIEKQFAGEVGQLNMSNYEKSLAQHLFIKIDAALIEADKKRTNDVPMVWKNVDMRRLAIDAVHRVQLGLDALIPGSIYPIAYLNGKSKLYEIDLRVGYRGELYYTKQASLRPIRDIRVELVFSTDEFIVYKKGVSCEVEGYDFKIHNAFDRGELVGGFAYIDYEDSRGNELVVMSRKEIDKIRSTSKSDKFWGAWYEEMAYKTLVHKAAKKIVIDPHKINVTAFATVDAEEIAPDAHDAPEVLPDTMPAIRIEEDDAVIADDAPPAAAEPQTEEDPF